MCIPLGGARDASEIRTAEHERRFLVSLDDRTGIDFGVVEAHFVVTAESPEEAEMYVRQMLWDAETGCCDAFHIAVDELAAL